MAHIAVNTRLLLPGRLEGISRFGFELLRRVAAAHPEVQFTYFFDRPYDSAYLTSPNIRAEQLFPPARHPLLWHAWFHLHLRHRLSRLRPDLLFSPELYLSLHPSVPEIPTFHDLSYEHFPLDISPWAARYLHRYSPRYARHASEIVTVSEFTKQDLIAQYGLAAARIHVVYNGADQRFAPISEAEAAKVRATYSDGKPFFHFVGTIQPRKNLEHLLLAFERFKQMTNSDWKLLLVGRPGWQYQEAMDTYERLSCKDDVRFTGFVPDGVLNSLYAASQGLVFVPWLEGFGIPVVEAFRAGTPVIASSTSSLPEVAGDAALLVPPGEVGAIAEAMIRLKQEPGLATQLSALGLQRAQAFSWDRSAEALWAVFEPYLSSGKKDHGGAKTKHGLSIKPNSK